MKHKQTIFIFVLAAVSLAVLVFILIPDWRERSVENKQVMPYENDEAEYLPDLVDPNVISFNPEMRAEREEYLRSNISSISPEKEVLGGKFYITKITWVDADSAIVDYEDGHIALSARTIFGPGNIIISFSVLPAESPVKSDTEVSLSSPESGALISSPLEVLGEAKGNWFFEANIPVKLIDEEGRIIAQVGGQAQSDWMTSDFVPFKARLEFATAAAQGELVISRDNPSGLPENDASVKIPVRFK